jgi:hypothetical protein
MKKTYFYRNASGKTKAIKSGFCWPAFLFGPFWALVNGIWNVFFVLVALNIFWNIVESHTEKSIALSSLSLLFYMAMMFIMGKIGNALHVVSLEKKGFRLLEEAPTNS